MLTCSTDKLLVIRELNMKPNTPIISTRLNQISPFTSSSMSITSDGNIFAICQDRNLRTFSISGKIINTIKAKIREDEPLTKVITLLNKKYFYLNFSFQWI